MKQHITIDEMVAKGQPIFVRNTTYKSGKPMVILLEVRSLFGGSPQTVMIPAIKHPINLTMRAHPEALAACPDLRRYINGEYLELVSPEEATVELGRPGVQQIVRQALFKHEKRYFNNESNKLKFKVNTGPSVIDGPGDQPHAFVAPEEDELVGEEGAKPQPALRAKHTVNPRIVQLILDLKKDYRGRKDETLLELRSMHEETLSDEDLGHIINELGGKKTVKRVVQWAQKLLASRQELDEEDDVFSDMDSLRE
jgi:hypothetical protein